MMCVLDQLRIVFNIDDTINRKKGTELRLLQFKCYILRTVYGRNRFLVKVITNNE